MAALLHSSSIRKQFPSLQRKHNNLPMVFLDGPAGTQVPQSVIEAISHYYSTSNSIGTVNNFKLVRKLTNQYNAWLLLDAVHYAPHFSIDVQSLGCDFLLCSAYKFYGPHVGILYSRPGLLDQLPTDRLRTAGQKAPYSIETGTLNHAALAGVGAAVGFLASLGSGVSQREKLIRAYQFINDHGYRLASKLYQGWKQIPGLTMIGQGYSAPSRTPTVSFTMKGKTPWQICEHLAKKNICAWDGHFYAIRAIEVLGLLERGGVTRLGISLYNTEEEVNLTVASVGTL